MTTITTPRRTNSEYLSDATEGYSKGSEASRKAWETAKAQAVEEAQKPFFVQLDSEMRALVDRNLSDGAARLFLLLAKLGWKKEFGGRYNDRTGSVMIDTRRLAKLCGGASVNSFYHKSRSEKRDSKTGEVIRKGSETDGWLEELVNGGYIWIGKHRIPNIPPAKWPNVYNLCCHVPQKVTPNLPWLDGNFGSEAVQYYGEEQDLAAGNGESHKNGSGNHRNGQLPDTDGGDGQAPTAVTGKHRTEGRASTDGGDGQAPTAVTGKHRPRYRASTDGGDGLTVNPVHLREIGVGQQTLRSSNGAGEPPAKENWEAAFKIWERGLGKKFDKELRATLEDLKAEKQKLKDFPKPGVDPKESNDRLNQKINAVKERLFGPK